MSWRDFIRALKDRIVDFGLASDEIFVDLFAGGGGTSSGAEAVICRPVDIAVNHDEAAIAMHRANHPGTRHYREDVWMVDPREACGSWRCGVLWLSPDCKHFSRAKGGQPREKGIRSLADVAIRWAEAVRPRFIFLENVEEFEGWGPLDDDGKAIAGRKGELFRAWCGKLSDLGYRIEFRTLVAADYGAPTTRRRLFLVARLGDGPIIWPESTHGKGRSKQWRGAAQIIDWTLPCPSIFGRKKPLVEATMRRIARGIQRYVINAADPFVVAYYGQSGAMPVSNPLGTVTSNIHHALVTPFIAKHFGGPRQTSGTDARAPVGAITTVDHHALILPLVTKHFGGGQNGKAPPGLDVRSPLGAITESDHHAVTTAFLTKFYGTSTGASVRDPAPTITAGGGHIAEVRAFLMKYHGGVRGETRGQMMLEPIRTLDTSNRFGLVMVHGTAYEIIDIGMRMLSPAELFAAQGFPADYDILPMLHGKPITKTQQIALAGNSVPPPMSEALIRANLYPNMPHQRSNNAFH
jgi:DNA (cytosine-5)-methyltransferase 1